MGFRLIYDKMIETTELFSRFSLFWLEESEFSLFSEFFCRGVNQKTVKTVSFPVLPKTVEMAKTVVCLKNCVIEFRV